jgi:hypothetical protein
LLRLPLNRYRKQKSRLTAHSPMLALRRALNRRTQISRNPHTQHRLVGPLTHQTISLQIIRRTWLNLYDVAMHRGWVGKF